MLVFARQDTIASGEERALTWKFVVVIDVVHHPDLITCGEIPSDYFQLRILPQTEHWVEIIKTWDLISYSVQQTMCSLNARDSILVVDAQEERGLFLLFLFRLQQRRRPRLSQCRSESPRPARPRLLAARTARPAPPARSGTPRPPACPPAPARTRAALPLLSASSAPSPAPRAPARASRPPGGHPVPWLPR